MAKFQMQVLIKINGAKEWRSVRPSGSDSPYEYDSANDADQMVRMCYPDQARLGETRVVAVPAKED